MIKPLLAAISHIKYSRMGSHYRATNSVLEYLARIDVLADLPHLKDSRAHTAPVARVALAIASVMVLTSKGTPSECRHCSIRTACEELAAAAEVSAVNAHPLCFSHFSMSVVGA
jgi:hypothetical protein